MFAVRPICVQNSIFKMSGASPDLSLAEPIPKMIPAKRHSKSKKYTTLRVSIPSGDGLVIPGRHPGIQGCAQVICYVLVWLNLSGIFTVSATHFSNLIRSLELMNETLWFCCSTCKYNDQIISQLCTYHNSSTVVACAKMWYDRFIIWDIRARHIFIRLHYELLNSLWNGPY